VVQSQHRLHNVIHVIGENKTLKFVMYLLGLEVSEAYSEISREKLFVKKPLDHHVTSKCASLLTDFCRSSPDSGSDDARCDNTVLSQGLNLYVTA
ncbi:11540_t:CDS:1, partial [Racocetra persica]